jgi:hypothetical protein
MGLLSAHELSLMKGDVELLIATHSTSLVLRRQGSSHPAQTAAVINRRQTGKQVTSAGGQEMRQQVLVLGAVDLDIQRDDTFTVNGQLFRVIQVKPTYDICIQATAEAVE